MPAPRTIFTLEGSGQELFRLERGVDFDLREGQILHYEDSVSGSTKYKVESSILRFKKSPVGSEQRDLYVRPELWVSLSVAP